MSILRYLGNKYGYYPASDPELAWQVDSVVDATKDIVDLLAKIVWEADPEKKANMIKDLLTKPYPIFLQALNKRAETSGSQYLVGDKITTADFMFSSLIFIVIYNDALNP